MRFLPLWLDLLFRPSCDSIVLSFFSLFEALVRADPAVAGVGSRIINKYIWRFNGQVGRE